MKRSLRELEQKFRDGLKIFCAAIITAGILAIHPGTAVAAFVDWTSFDATANTAIGTLNTAIVSLVTTDSPPSFDPNGGVFGGVTDGTFTGYANPSFFSPSVALTDGIVVSSSSSFQLTFSTPLINPRLHISQLAGSTWTFDAPFTLVSSDGDLTTTANSVRGPAASPSPDDGNGSLLFSGSFTELSWITSTPNVADGVVIQISADGPSAVPEPGTLVLLASGLAAMGFRLRQRGRQSATRA